MRRRKHLLEKTAVQKEMDRGPLFNPDVQVPILDSYRHKEDRRMHKWDFSNENLIVYD